MESMAISALPCTATDSVLPARLAASGMLILRFSRDTCRKVHTCTLSAAVL